LNEPELTVRLKQGDQLAFRQLVDTWKDMVYNTALGLVQSEMDAEDVAQDVFTKAWDSIQGFKGESKLSTWLYRITVTKSLDLLRSKKRKKRFAYVRSIFGNDNDLLVNPPDFLHPGVQLENRERSMHLFKAIELLPQQQKVAFVLTRIEGLNHKEVSEVLGTTVPAIESLLQRARLNLKKELEIYYRKHS
jgi:RNA polymerase sigma factor (sigma-70 family)